MPLTGSMLKVRSLQTIQFSSSTEQNWNSHQNQNPCLFKWAARKIYDRISFAYLGQQTNLSSKPNCTLSCNSGDSEFIAILSISRQYRSFRRVGEFVPPLVESDDQYRRWVTAPLTATVRHKRDLINLVKTENIIWVKLFAFNLFSENCTTIEFARISSGLGR